MTSVVARLELDNLPHDVLERVAECLNHCDRRALLHLALAAPAFYAACLHVAIHTDTKDSTLSDVHDRVAGDSLDVASFQLDSVGTIQDMRQGTDSGRPSWHLILLPRNANRALVPMPNFSDFPESVDWHWSLLPVPNYQLRHCNAYPSLRFWMDAVDVPPHCTNLRLSYDIDFDMIAMPRLVVKLVLEEVQTVVLAPSDDGAGALLPHLREFCVSFDLSLALDPVKSVAAASALFTFVPLSLKVLKFEDLGAGAMQEAAKLVRQLPSLAELHVMNYSHRTVEGFDLVMAALPRSGFPSLHLHLDTFDVVEAGDKAKEASIISRLVASFPHSVQSLTIHARAIWFSHVPLASNELTIGIDAIFNTGLPRLTPNLFPPTLKRFVLTQHGSFQPNLVPLLEQLPASLVHFELSYVKLSRTDLAFFARSFPPHLKSLHLHGTDLTAADLDELLAGAWPATLTHLDLSMGFQFVGRLPVIAPGIRVLTMNLVRAMAAPGGDAMVATWIVALPQSVRVLKLFLDSTRRSGRADVMLTVTRVRAPGWRRMHEWNEAFELPAAISTALAGQFCAFDVLRKTNGCGPNWGRMLLL